LTDDNPRSEDPVAIVQDILAGMECPDTVLVEHDRAQAIAQALARATLGDVVLVAGKGHEDYQIRGARRLPYSDRETVAEFLGVSGHG
jgi:UDP-N-acetylmuramoyl-L-alanyl-D-glutamate--2,6-diaminopimelate ligase